MSWSDAMSAVLVHSVWTGCLVLIAATLAAALLRQPARRIVVIELALVALLLLPLLRLASEHSQFGILPAGSRPVVAITIAADPSRAPEPQSPRETPDPKARTVAAPRALALAPAEPAAAPLVADPAPDTATTSAIIAAPPPVAPPARAEPAAAAARPGAPANRPADARTVADAPLQVPASARQWLLILYAIGVAASVAWSAVGWLAARRLLRASRPAGSELQALLADVAGPAAARVTLLVSPRAAQPCALVSFRSTIVLPQSWCDPTGAAHVHRLRFALAHEWSHVARGDTLAWALAGVVRWFYFYQPLVWLLRRQLQLSQDYLADAHASARGAQAEDYAEFLTTCAAGLAPPALSPGLGILSRSTDLERRVVMLITHKPLEVRTPRRWNLLAIVAAVAAVGVLAILHEQPASQAQPPASDSRIGPQKETAESVDPLATQPPDGASKAGKGGNGGKGTSAGNKGGTYKLQAEAVKQAPRQKAIARGDGLRLEAVNIDWHVGAQPTMVGPTSSFAPAIDDVYHVDADGDLVLPPGYGRVHVAGLSLEKAEAAIADHLLPIQRQNEKEQAEFTKIWKNYMGDGPLKVGQVPRVQLTRVQGNKPQFAQDRPLPIRLKSGDQLRIQANRLVSETSATMNLVVQLDEDGIPLGPQFGRVHVIGRTLSEAEEAVREKLAQSKPDQLSPLVAVKLMPPGPALPAIYAPPSFLAQPLVYSQYPSATPSPPPVEPTLLPLDTIELFMRTDAFLPVNGTYLVEPNGDVLLPYGMGRVNVKGKSDLEAADLLRARIAEKRDDRYAPPRLKVLKRGHAVYPEGKTPSADYRIAKGDLLLIGNEDYLPQRATPYLVQKDSGKLLVPNELLSGTIRNLAYKIEPRGEDLRDYTKQWEEALKEEEDREALHGVGYLHVDVAGLTLIEAQQAVRDAMQAAIERLFLAAKPIMIRSSEPPVVKPIYLTLGGWKEEATAEAIQEVEHQRSLLNRPAP